MSDNTLANDTATDATSDILDNQAQTKTYSEKEVNDMMARMKSSLQKKLLKPYEDLGDPEELRVIRQEHEKRQTEQQLKRGEFEKTLQELASKKDAEIARRDAVIREFKVDAPLTSAAAKFRAVNAEQVRSLLKPNLRLNEQGDVEVVDPKGGTRYNDRGEPLQVEDLVREFLDSNPHFVSATPATSYAQTSHSTQGASSIKDLDVSKLNMNKPEDRARYREYKKATGR
jgi:hypothetical protein